ncbi:hypothetical protein ACWKWC_02455 [Geodermatophilus nigrescens]
MSEWVTWECCPRCGGMAALGWLDGEIVEFDCVRGCNVTTDDVSALSVRAQHDP